MGKFQDLVKGEKPVLVDFSAEWCGPCKALAPILQQLSKKMGDGVRIIKIDVDKNKLLASQMKIQGVPTLMLYQNGQMLWRQSGVMSAVQLEGIIRQKTKQPHPRPFS